jgi:uncharacterized membrane protein HdeD (DUF308 family)
LLAVERIRIIQIIIGIIAISMSLLALTSPFMGVIVSIGYLFAIALAAFGVERIIVGTMSKSVDRWSRAGNVGLGAAVIAAAALDFAFPALAFEVLAILLGLGLLAAGAGKVIHGVRAKGANGWFRAAIVGTGALGIVFAIGVIVSPVFAAVFTALLLSLAFLMLGAESLIEGVTGKRERILGIKR